MTFFDDKYSNIPPVDPLLPLFHSCDGFTFRSILEDRAIKTSECDVFKLERLLYLFYGKPAYKSPFKQNTKLKSFFPVCFVLDGSAIDGIKRIMPFDSGAYNAGLFKDYLHPKMTMDSFFMHPKPSSIGKTVSYFFENNSNYFSFTPKSDIVYDELDFEIESYHNLIRSVAQSPVDDRKACIEVQLEKDIQLTPGIVKAVIIPLHLKSSALVKDVLIDHCNATIITYESFGVASDLYYTQILQLAKEYIINNCKSCL